MNPVMQGVSILMLPLVLTITECQTSYENVAPLGASAEIGSDYERLIQLMNYYTYAMDPEKQEDKSLITDLPNLYSDVLEAYTAKQGGAIDDEILCHLLIAIFKNYANIIKDKLSKGKFPHVSKKYVESTSNWSIQLLDITLQKGFTTTQRVCDKKTRTPLELACSLMLHRPLMMLTEHGVHDIEQLYNCLLLTTVNSDVEGFDIIWRELCHVQQCQDGCKVISKTIPTTAIFGKAARNINLSIIDVANFHCKKSHSCIMLDHICNALCYDACSLQLWDVLSAFTSHHIKWSDHHQRQLSCPHSYKHIINGCHGWRTGFVMETDACQIPSVNIGQLSEEMLEFFAAIKQPLVIKGVGQDWDLSTKWTKKYLQRHFGDIEVLVRMCYI